MEADEAAAGTGFNRIGHELDRVPIKSVIICKRPCKMLSMDKEPRP